MSEAFDLAHFAQGHLARLAAAADLGELARQADAALAALLPGQRYALCWLDGPGAAELPDEPLLPLLREGIAASDPVEGGAWAPVRGAGDLIGLIRIAQGRLTGDQERALGLLSAVLGPAYLALRRAPPPPLERRKAELRPALDRLRGAQAVQPLLHEVCALVRSAVPFPNAICTLRYRDSEWFEIGYVMAGGHAGRAPVYWRDDAGLSGAVIKSGQSLYTDSYLDECARRGIAPFFLAEPTPVYAWMGVPLRDNGTIFGTLNAFGDQPQQALDADDRALLVWLSDELSGLIRGAQRYQQVEEESRRREGLIKITRALNSSLDPEYVPTLIVERAPVLLDAEEGSLLLLDDDTGELIFSYAAGPAGQQLLGQRLPAGKGIAGFVAASGQAAIVNNAGADGRFYRALDGNTGFNTRSILAVPLRGLDGVRGVIEVLNRRDDAPFTDEDRALLEALADQAMIALENARKFASVDQALARRAQDLDRSNDRLHKILRASNVLRTERLLDGLLPQIAGVVSESSGFRSAMIALVQRERAPEPYLRRVAAAGPHAAALAAVGERRLPLARFEALLRPEFRRGSLTYLVEGRHDEYAWLRDHALAHHDGAEDGRPGAWQPGDTLFCLLRNSRGELIGLLGFDNPEDGLRPGEAQVQILEILANQAAAAIENAHLHADQQQSLNRMLALNALGRAISTTVRAPQEIYELTTRAMQEMGNASWATIFLGDPAAGPLVASFHTGGAPTDGEVALLAREALAARRPVSRLPGRDGSGEALIGIPLRGSERTLGAICVGYSEGRPDAAEVETLILFASQAAAAVEGLRLLGEVREGRDQLASIMASTREGILLVDDAGAVAVANGAFIGLAGADGWAEAASTPGDLAGLPVVPLLERWQAAEGFPPAELELLAGGVAAVADGREIFVRGQLNSALPSGRALEWTVLRATREGAGPLDLPAPAEIRRWPILLTARDITAAKETERLRNDLTNMMVHDLRSPLTSILTSIDMLFRGITGEVTNSQREILTIAYTSAQNVLNMVNLLLDISRLEGGRMPLERSALAVEGLVERAAGRMSVIARNKNIAIDVEVSPGAAYVFADGELVLRVLQNLLDNALKFSPKGGRVLLSADVVPGQFAPPAEAEGAPFSMDAGRAVRFAVRDSGVGIRPGDLEKIFLKFGQAGNRRNAGSGLGLTFCKLVAEAHGGTIWVESAPGSGSTFAFT
ncbi:MAG TPA: GAF domain-containing protein, partial [Chloroflexaceae bacterium]|nr:GAF domain-containing protein [Chloroflexaceae bacterium]